MRMDDRASYYHINRESTFRDAMNKVNYFSALFGLYFNCLRKFQVNAFRHQMDFSKEGVRVPENEFLSQLTDALNKA